MATAGVQMKADGGLDEGGSGQDDNNPGHIFILEVKSIGFVGARCERKRGIMNALVLGYNKLG